MPCRAVWSPGCRVAGEGAACPGCAVLCHANPGVQRERSRGCLLLLWPAVLSGAMLCRAMPCCAALCFATVRCATLCCALLCRAVQCHAVPILGHSVHGRGGCMLSLCHAVLCHPSTRCLCWGAARSCPAVPCCAVLCCAVPCRAIPGCNVRDRGGCQLWLCCLWAVLVTYPSNGGVGGVSSTPSSALPCPATGGRGPGPDSAHATGPSYCGEEPCHCPGKLEGGLWLGAAQGTHMSPCCIKG